MQFIYTYQAIYEGIYISVFNLSIGVHPAAQDPSILY
jgi:hypothetical protein